MTKYLRLLPDVFLLCLSLLIPAVADAANTKTYTSEQYKVQISYPDDWIDKGTLATDLLNPRYSGEKNSFSFGPKQEGQIIVSVNPSKPLGLRQFRKSLQTVLTSMDPNIKIDSAKEISVNGLKGFSVVYGKGSDYGRNQVFVFYHGGMRYTIMAAVFDLKPGIYDEYASTIDSVVQSFRIIN